MSATNASRVPHEGLSQAGVRFFICAGSIAVSICVGFLLYSSYATASSLEIGSLPFNSTVEKALDNRRGFAASLSQLTLLIIGALWTTLALKEGSSLLRLKARRSDILMFILANTVLALSAVFYYLYEDRIASSALADAGALKEKLSGMDFGDKDLEALAKTMMPDFFGARLAIYYELQVKTLVLGVILALLCVFMVLATGDRNAAESPTQMDLAKSHNSA